MKRTLFILLAFTLPMLLLAQESKSQKEVGILFSSMNSFGLSYKTGTSTALWRFQSLYLNAFNIKNTSSSSAAQENNFGFDLSAGREWRKLITPQLELRYGADLLFSINHSSRENPITSYTGVASTDTENRYSPGIDLVFGFNYIINKNLSVGAEVNPYFSITTGKYRNSNGTSDITADFSEINYGMSNRPVLLNLTYRF